MAAEGELSTAADGLNSFPVPTELLVEEEFSKKIYVEAGYSKVTVMPRVYRLDYLSKVSLKREKQHRAVLIAPGLHDGAFLLKALSSRIERESETSFILNPHPRSNNDYVRDFTHLENLSVSNGKLFETLSIVDKVCVTYSSVAIEAYILGLEVEVIEIPGLVNQSPMVDKDFVEIARNIAY